MQEIDALHTEVHAAQQATGVAERKARGLQNELAAVQEAAQVHLNKQFIDLLFVIYNCKPVSVAERKSRGRQDQLEAAQEASQVTYDSI